MNNKWKIGILTGMLMAPAAVAMAETDQSNSTQSTEVAINRAITYFEGLNFNSSMADLKFYEELLLNAFPSSDPEKPDVTNAGYKLLNGKLEYIKAFNTNKLAASSLKQEIGLLTLTNKNLVESVDYASTKYNNLIKSFEQINQDVMSLKNLTVNDKNYNSIFWNLFGVGDRESQTLKDPELATITIAGLIEQKNQELLSTRKTQVDHIVAEGVPGKIEKLYKANTATDYQVLIDDYKKAYNNLTTEEKTIADNQVVPTSALTYKQVLQKAEENIAKAAQFDFEIASLSSIQVDPQNDTSITNLKNQLIKIDKAYNALTPLQQALILPTSQNVIAPFQNILTVSGKITLLKPDSSAAYREAVSDIELEITNLPEITLNGNTLAQDIVKKIVPNMEKLNTARTDLNKAIDAENAIKALKTSTPPTTAQIENAKKLFNELSSTQKKLVNNVSDLNAWTGAGKNAAAVDKKIEAIVISTKEDFYKKFKAAQDAYKALNQEIEAPFVSKASKLEALEPYAEFIRKYYALNQKDADYSTKLVELLSELVEDSSNAEPNPWDVDVINASTVFTDEEKTKLVTVRGILLDQNDSTNTANMLVSSIDKLGDYTGPALIKELNRIRTVYNELDSNSKKLVVNIKKLTEAEKANKPALTFIQQVEALNPLDPKFVKAAQTARNNYKKLSQTLKDNVANAELTLQEYEKISNVMFEIDNLQKSKEILVDAEKAETNLDALVKTLYDISVLKSDDVEKVKQLLEGTYKSKLALALAREEQVGKVINDINELSKVTTDVGIWITSIGESYKKLSSNDKKLVKNYATFKTIDKNYKAALKVINLIKDLPKQDAKDYSKKIESAYKAYGKLSDDQKKYVANYEQGLKPYIAVASLIGDIANLKSSNKDYGQTVQKLVERYDALSEDEKKQIYNYKDLAAAVEALKGPDNVIKLIQEARPGVENYLDKLMAARDAYDGLSSDLKKQVTNYKTLQDREKAVKPVLELTDTIEKIGLQSSAKNFISMYEKAQKAYGNIGLQDRLILTNEKLLTETYVPLYRVMKQIESIKDSSNTFVADTKAARAAFNALTQEQQAKILNKDVLIGHEANVEGGKYVDDLIRALKSNTKEVYVAKVQEAEAAYKALSSSNKKAVTLYPELQAELKFIAPVIQAMKEIDLLSVSGDKLAAQVKKVNTALAKLTDEQLSLIPNMDKYNNLGNVIKVVGLIELINPSDTKYYIGNTKAAEIAYQRLSPDEKQRVTNYSKLEEALLNVQALDQITKKISELSRLSNTFVTDVEKLLAEYKLLPSALKKQVSNYSALEQAKKDIDAADKVINSIRSIDPNVRTFESKVVSAKKAFDKLTEEQRALVTNARLLQQYITELGL